jgi:hypothetical protein
MIGDPYRHFAATFLEREHDMTSSSALTREFGPSFIIDVATIPQGGQSSLSFSYVAGGVIVVDDTTLAVTYSYQDVPTELGTIDGISPHQADDDGSYTSAVHYVADADIADWLNELFFVEATHGQSEEKLADEGYIAGLRERTGHLATELEADLRDNLARSRTRLTSNASLSDLLACLLGVDAAAGSLNGFFGFSDGVTTVQISTTAYW